MKRLISIVVPVYNEEEIIEKFYQMLRDAISPLTEHYDFEIVFTNNASTDGSVTQIKKLLSQDRRIKLVSYSRNFGYQASILGGITEAKGDAIVIIDVDGEDPPTMIPSFVEQWEEGYQIVYGIRKNRPEPAHITMLRRGFYRVLKLVADTEIILDMAEFSLFTKVVRDSMIASNNTFPFLRAEIAYSGHKKIGIAYDRQPRLGGSSNYNLWGMCHFAVSGILSISTFPLRIAGYGGPVLLLLNLLLFPLTLLFAKTYYPLLLILWLNLLFLIFVAIFVSLYVARIYKNGISRQVYIIEEILPND